jgi:hypothetical protein
MICPKTPPQGVVTFFAGPLSALLGAGWFTGYHFNIFVFKFKIFL